MTMYLPISISGEQQYPRANDSTCQGIGGNTMMAISVDVFSVIWTSHVPFQRRSAASTSRRCLGIISESATTRAHSAAAVDVPGLGRRCQSSSPDRWL